MIAHTYYLRDARVQREAETLASAGYEVHVVCAWEPADANGTRLPREEVVNGVSVHRVRLTRKRGGVARYIYEYVMMTILGMCKLVSLRGKEGFAAVHVHTMPDFLVFAGLPLKWHGATTVLDVHDPMPELFQENYHLPESHVILRVLRLQERISYRYADYIITVNEAMVDNIARKARCTAGEIRLVRNLPDVRKFPLRREARNVWPFHREAITMLYCGTITEHYSLETAVRAVARLSGSIPNLRFQILGEGSRLSAVLALAEDLGVRDRVEHVMPVSQNRVVDIMEKADLGISTHCSGAFGDLYFSTKLLEFMTQGLPVISSRTRAIEAVLPDSAVFYFTPGDAEDLASQIRSMCSNPELVVQKIRKSSELICAHTWQQEQDKLLRFYRELTA